MFCSKCGRQIKEEFGYCTYCASPTKMKEELESYSEGIERAPKSEKRYKISLSNKMLITMLSVIAVIVFVQFINSSDYHYKKNIKKADKLYSNMNYEEALMLYEEALQYIPDGEEAHNGKIKVLLLKAKDLCNKGLYEEALKNYEYVLSEGSNEEAKAARENCWLRIAKEQYAEGNYEQALYNYELILSQKASKEAQDGKIECCFVIANENYNLGKYEEAIENYEKIRALNYTLADLYMDEANAYLKMDNIFKALGVLEAGKLYNNESVLQEKIDDIISKVVIAECVKKQWNGLSVCTKYEYDNKGNRIKQISCDLSGNQIGGWYEYEYDERDNQIGKISYESDGTISGEDKREYDERGNITKEISYSSSDMIGWLEYEYDNRGNQTKKSSYDKKGFQEWCDTYEYNDENNIIKQVSYNSKNTVSVQYKYEYEKNDEEEHIFMNKYDGNGQLVGKVETIYDSDGNEIRYMGYSIYINKMQLSSDWIYEYKFDEAGREILKVERETQGNQMTWSRKREYDLFGNVLKESFWNVNDFLAGEKTDTYTYKYHYIG